MKRTLMMPGLMLLAAGSGFTQTGPKTQVFEAADVRTTTSVSDDFAFLVNGRMEARGVTMLRLIAMAYRTSPNFVSGGPGWLTTDRYDVIAMAPAATSTIAQRNMLQNLLTERFHLSVNKEQKPMPALALTLAKKGVAKASDGKGDPSCDRAFEDTVISLTCRNVTMASLTEHLQEVAPGYFNLPTVDHTGLTGAFSFRLEWKGRGRLTGPSDGMSLFNALEKQLGVKVHEETLPHETVNVLSVDRTPTPNAPDITSKLGKAPTEFEVAEIRPSRPDEKEDFRASNGRIDVRAAQIRDLIAFAYDVEDDWVRGADKSLTDRFDIIAKTAPTESNDTLKVLLQAMLADRFKLKIHEDTQPVAVYGLTANKIKLKESAPSARSACVKRAIDGALALTCTNTTMEQFVKRIREAAGGYLEHPVVDLTKLKGGYDFTVSWAPRNRTLGNGQRPADTPGEAGGLVPAAPDGATGGLTVFEAIDRQLGLKLAPAKHPMRVIVIDSIQRLPTEN